MAVLAPWLSPLRRRGTIAHHERQSSSHARLVHELVLLAPPDQGRAEGAPAAVRLARPVAGARAIASRRLPPHACDRAAAAVLAAEPERLRQRLRRLRRRPRQDVVAGAVRR